MQLEPSAVFRQVAQPLAIGRDDALDLAQSSARRQFRHRVPGRRQGVDVVSAVRKNLLKNDRPVARPVCRGLEQHVRLIEGPFRRTIGQLLDVEVTRAAPVARKQKAGSIGRPDRRLVASASGREERHAGALYVEQPER